MMAYLFVDPAALAPETGRLAWLIALSVKGALVLSAAAMISLMLRRSSAASRHLVWSLALAGLFALPLLSLVLPSWQWSPLPAVLSSPEAPPVSPASSPAVHVTVSPLAADVQPRESSAAPVSPAGAKALSASPAASPAIAPSSESRGLNRASLPLAQRLSWWLQWAMAGWLIGVALIVAHLLVGVARIWHLTRRAETVRGAEWLLLVERLSRRLALTRPVVLRRSARVTMPMACGFIRPSVLLPADVNEWPDERREVVLLHELAHVKRRDCLTQLIAQAACAIYWFNPLVWVAARRLRIERERACDDQVLDAGAKASDYAGHLLDIARSMGAAPSALVAAVAIARRSQLEGRLLAILDPRLRRRALSRVTVAFIAVAMICVVLPLAMLRPAASAQTRRAKATAMKPASAPQLSGGAAVASPPLAPAPAIAAAPPDAEFAPVEGEASPEAAPVPPDAPGLIEAAPAIADAPQSSLNQQDKDAIVEGLREALKDDDPEMREQALFTLIYISGPRATEAILSVLKDSNPEVREQAVWALGLRRGEGHVDALIAALRDASAGVREKAAWSLGLRGNARSVDALVAALRDEKAEVREKAAWALGLKGNRNAVEPLIAALSDQSADVRATAAWALGLRGDARAINALNAAMKDDNHDVRDKARWALGLLLIRSGEADANDGDGDKDDDIDEDVDGVTSAAVSGGVAGGVGGGIAKGVSGGVAGGVAGGVRGRVRGVITTRQRTEEKSVIKGTTRQKTTPKQP